jgi:phospholipase/lecithinase/hemolysin
MRTKKMSLLVFVLSLFFAVHSAAFAHPTYSKVVVFGDSLSDPGNAFALTGQFSKRPFSLIPDAPYARGGMHFSNGKTWVELLAKDLQLPSGPAFRNPRNFSNYAIGGARARSVTGADLTDQVGLYLSEHGGAADPNALYVILIGGNDIRDAIVALQSDPSGATSGLIVQQAVTSVAGNLQSLAAAGAHYFLIGNAPNLAQVPAVALQGEPLTTYAQQLSDGYNAGLQAAVAGVSSMFSLDVAHLDVYALLQSLETDPQQIGLTNVTGTCIHPGVIAHAVCSDTKDYLFWDGIHPTHTVHSFLANQALKALH